MTRTGHGDSRFDEIRQHFSKLLAFFILQMIWIWTINLPLTFLNSPKINDSSEGLDQNFGSVTDILGVILFIVGFLMETVADVQKLIFRTRRTSSKEFIKTGLWAWTHIKQYKAGNWSEYSRRLSRTSCLIPFPPSLYEPLPQFIKSTLFLEFPMYRFDLDSNSQDIDHTANAIVCSRPVKILYVFSVIDLISTFRNDVLVGQKAGIRRLNKDALIKNACTEFVITREEARRLYKFVLASTELVTHDQWLEQNHVRKLAVKGFKDVLLQEIKANILRRVDKGSENTLIGKLLINIAHLIDAAMYSLPIGCEIELDDARGDRPDLMIWAFLRQKWNEVVYFESGRWSSTDKKNR
ncbi:39893_t:CDS:2, partial [Gigaspora margarita]